MAETPAMTEQALASERNASAGGRLLRTLLEPLAIDVRSLAAYRIAVATVLLLDLAGRTADLTDHYTDDGAFPRTARIALEQSQAYGGTLRYEWSLHMFSGERWGEATLFLIAAACACGMLVGYRTRLCTAASWLLLASVQARNHLALDAGDTLLRVVMFWSMFLPLGAVVSVDRWRDRSGKPARREVLSIAGAAILLQIAMMYWCTAAAKHHPIWNQEYTAVYYALNLDVITTPFGQSLLPYPRLMQALTFIAYWLEWLGPCFALCPLLTRWPRAVVVLCFWLLHLGMAVTMRLGLLEWMVMAAWVVYLPGVVWDALGRCCSGKLLSALAARPAIRRTVDAIDRRCFRHPSAADFRLSWATSALVGALLLYTAVWNLNELSPSFRDAFRLPHGWKIPGRVTRLAQHWWMFAPQPMMNDGWYAMKGVLEDGSTVNLWSPGEPLPIKKPPSVLDTYRNQRWRRYLMSLWEPYYAPYVRDLSHWLQRRWDEQYSEGKPERKVKSVEIIYYIEETPPPDQISTHITPMILWKSEYEAFMAPPGAGGNEAGR